MANDIEVSVGFEDVQTLRRELVGISKDAKSSASVFEREYNKVERSLKATAKASQSYYSSLLNLDKASKSASSSASIFEKALNRDAAATKSLAIEKDRLAKAYVPLYAQSKLYEVELEKLNRAQALGVLSDKQRQTSLEQLNTSFAKGTGVFSKYSQEVSRRTNSMGVVMQQTGYQVGDFLVQVQSGTNPMVAFGQQATQLVGVLPLMTGLFGLSATALIGLSAGLGIAIPLVTAIGAAWLRSSKSNEVATKSLTAYKKAQEEVSSAIVTTQQKLDKLTFGVDETYQAELLKEQIRLREEFNKKTAEYNAYLENTTDSIDRQRITTADMLKDLNAIKKVYEDNNKSLETQNRLGAAYTLMQNVRKTTEKDNEDYLKRQAEYLQQQVDKGIAINNAMMAREKGYRQQTKYAEDLSKAVTKALQDGTDLSKLDIGRGIVAASVAAETLAKNLGISLATATRMVSLSANTPAENLAALKFKNTPAYNPLNTNPNMQGFTVRPVPERFTPEPKKTNKSTGGGGTVAGKVDTQEEYLAKLVREYDMKKKSLGMTDQQIKRNEFIFTLDEKIATMKSKVSDTEIEALRKQSIAAYDLYQASEKQAAIMDRVTGSIETMFMSFEDGTKSVGEAFKNMLRDILMQIYQEKVAKPAATGLSNVIGSIFGGATGGINIGKSGSLFGGASWSANGDIVASSGIQAFANGGVVSSPTMFQHGGGLGVMGEAGPEAIMPLKRGANGKLGVQMEGSSSSDSVVINQTFNFSANGDDSVKKIIAQAAPQIAQMTQKQIMDSRRRGGSMKAAFG